MISGKKFILAAVLPLLILFILPMKPIAISHFGDSVVLQASSRNPKDVFRGEYIDLSFSIASLSPELFNSAKVSRGSIWYVAIFPDESGLWSASGAYSTPPEGVYLTATVERVSQASVTVDYGKGLERLYVKEGTGKDFKAAGGLRVNAKVWDGEAVAVSVEAIKSEAK